jgi:hypothetical protein
MSVTAETISPTQGFHFVLVLPAHQILVPVIIPHRVLVFIRRVSKGGRAEVEKDVEIA